MRQTHDRCYGQKSFQHIDVNSKPSAQTSREVKRWWRDGWDVYLRPLFTRVESIWRNLHTLTPHTQRERERASERNVPWSSVRSPKSVWKSTTIHTYLQRKRESAWMKMAVAKTSGVMWTLINDPGDKIHPQLSKHCACDVIVCPWWVINSARHLAGVGVFLLQHKTLTNTFHCWSLMCVCSFNHHLYHIQNLFTINWEKLKRQFTQK